MDFTTLSKVQKFEELRNISLSKRTEEQKDELAELTNELFEEFFNVYDAIAYMEAECENDAAKFFIVNYMDVTRDNIWNKDLYDVCKADFLDKYETDKMNEFSDGFYENALKEFIIYCADYFDLIDYIGYVIRKQPTTLITTVEQSERVVAQ